MAYDEDLADRVRAAVPLGAEVTERKMFGGLAFLLNGHMFAGVVGNELMVRLGYDAAQQALEREPLGGSRRLASDPGLWVFWAVSGEGSGRGRPLW